MNRTIGHEETGESQDTVFQRFREEFLRELSLSEFGERSIQSLRQDEKSPAAKELERRTKARDVLRRESFLREAHHLLREYSRLVAEQTRIKAADAKSGVYLKRLGNHMKTIRHLQKQILDLAKRLGNRRTRNEGEAVDDGMSEVRSHLGDALKALRDVEDELDRKQELAASLVHPELTKKHHSAMYKTRWEPLYRGYDYELDSLKKKAPQQWLVEKLYSKVRQCLQDALTDVTHSTACRVVAELMLAGGLTDVPDIKQYFIDKKNAAKRRDNLKTT